MNNPIEKRTYGGTIFYVSQEDSDFVDQYSWIDTGRGYIARNHERIGNYRKRTQLHRAIGDRMFGGIPKNKIIDHIDRNPKNNCRENIRLATYSNNQWNRVKSRNNTSGYKGVVQLKKTGRFIAMVGYKNYLVRIGSFPTVEEAYEAYCAIGSKLHGKFFIS